MRSVLLSVVLSAGALGFALATPAQARTDELVGPGITNGNTMPVAYRGWYGGWGGRGYYGGGGYGFSRGFYPYGGYGGYGFSRGYYPGYYGGYSPFGGYRSRYYYGGGFSPYGGFRARPFSGFYGPGFYW